MQKSLLVGSLIGVAVIVGGVGAAAGLKHAAKEPTYAEVVRVAPVFKTVQTPRQACHDEQVTHQKEVKDEHRIAGTAIGAVVGGLLGNQIGGGDGKKIATVAGAAAGGYAGNRVQDKMQKANTYTTTEKRCETVSDSAEKAVGYKVTYKLAGKTATVRMDHDPGERIPVRDGKLVLSKPKVLAKS
jgi:uncharacterized protein YcfJ